MADSVSYRLVRPQFTALILLDLLILAHCHQYRPNNNEFHHSYSQYRPISENEISVDTVHKCRNEIPEVPPPKPGWIDPFDMLEGTRHSTDSLIIQGDVDNYNLKQRLQRYEMFMKRFINVFLRAVESKDPKTPHDMLRNVKLEFLVDGKELSVLRNFGQLGDDGAKLESVSEVLDLIFSQIQGQDEPRTSTAQQLLRWLQGAFVKLISTPEWTVVSSVSLMLFVTLWSVYKSHSYRLALFTLILTIFLAGFGFTWIRMYEEEEIKRYADQLKHRGQVPHHCAGDPMKWYEHMFYRMFGDDCAKFFETRDIRPIVKISPTIVLGETVSSIFIKPATNIGKAYGSFIAGTTESLPFWLKIVLIPLISIIPLLVAMILLAFYCNYHLSISWTGFHLMPDWRRSQIPIQHKRHDPYVEDLPSENMIRHKESGPLAVQQSETNTNRAKKGIQPKSPNGESTDRVQTQTLPATEKINDDIDISAEVDEPRADIKQQPSVERKIRTIHTLVAESSPSEGTVDDEACSELSQSSTLYNGKDKTV